MGQRGMMPARMLMALTMLARPIASQVATLEELRGLSEALQDGELDDEGLAVFRREAARHPDDWRVHGMLGQALASKGLPDAVDALRVAAKLAPHVGQVAYSLAAQLGTPDAATAKEAADLYRRALRLAPTLGDANAFVQVSR